MIRDYLIRQVWEQAEPAIADLGYDLIEVAFMGGKGRSILRIYIDSEGGIIVDDCARVSRMLHSLFEAEGVDDMIGGAYNLEVSSPGLNRPLRRPQDFIRFVGENVKIVLEEPEDGRKNFRGALAECDGETLVLKDKDKEWKISLSNIEKANIEYSFD